MLSDLFSDFSAPRGLSLPLAAERATLWAVNLMRNRIEIDHLLGLDAMPLGEPPVAPAASSPAATPPAGPVETAAQRPGPPPRPAPARTATPAAGSAPPATAIELVGRDMTTEQKTHALAELERELTDWVHANWPRDGWQNVVFGEGDVDAAIMFIGEAPGADEDARGRPFVGRAGQLLDKQITAMKLERGQVYIANIGKARPPGNRVPTVDEAALWLPWLHRQIGIIAPRVIVSLGATSAKYLLDEPKLAITRQRGQWRNLGGIPLMPTFHPAYLLRAYTRENREAVWSDLKAVLAKLEDKPSPR